jgi:hypothetical protein
MKWKLLLLVLIPAAHLLAAAEFSANYDTTKSITIEGVITKLENWDSWYVIGLNVKDANGRVANWAIDGPRSGWVAGSGLREHCPPVSPATR